MISFSLKPVFFFISSKEILSAQAIPIISLLDINYFIFFKYACAAERRAIGTLYGEQDT